MHFSWHLLVSALFALAFFVLTGSTGGTLAFFFAGVLIDLDHVLDCFILQGKLSKDIFDNRHHALYSKRILVSFHSLELVVLVPFFKFSPITIGLALGMLSHMLSDFVYYRPTRQKSVFSMFFTYRMSQRFSAERLCRA